MRNRLLGACALALAATSLSATPAAASTATVAGPNVYYGAAPGETNRVTVAADCEPGCAEVTITDAGATITPGAGCSQGIDAHQVTCDLTALGLTGGILVLADLSDMNDSAEATTDTSCGCQGGSGDDVFKRTGIGPLGNGVMAY